MISNAKLQKFFQEKSIKTKLLQIVFFLALTILLVLDLTFSVSLIIASIMVFYKYGLIGIVLGVPGIIIAVMYLRIVTSKFSNKDNL